MSSTSKDTKNKTPTNKSKGKIQTYFTDEFTGDLAKPLINGLLGDEYIRRERVRRLGLLLDHYGLSQNDEHWQIKLIFSLAIDFVPGMQIQEKPSKKRGRPAKEFQQWKRLHDDVLKLKSQGYSLREACRNLKETDQWRHYGTARSLETAYRKAAERVRWNQALAAALLNREPTGVMGGLFGLGTWSDQKSTKTDE